MTVNLRKDHYNNRIRYNEQTSQYPHAIALHIRVFSLDYFETDMIEYIFAYLGIVLCV